MVVTVLLYGGKWWHRGLCAVTYLLISGVCDLGALALWTLLTDVQDYATASLATIAPTVISKLVAWLILWGAATIIAWVSRPKTRPPKA